MHLANRLIILASHIFLVSCTPFTTREFRESDKLHHNTGIVLAMISTNNPYIDVSLKKKDSRKTASITLQGAPQYDNRYYRLAIMEVDSGFTSFDTISLQNKYMIIEEGRRTWVEVKPLQITFLGALYIDVQEGDSKLRFAINMNPDKIMPLVKEHYPWLLERYPINERTNIKNTSNPQ